MRFPSPPRFSMPGPLRRLGGRAPRRGGNGLPPSIYDFLQERVFGWSTPAPDWRGNVPAPWRVRDKEAAARWLRTVAADPGIWVDYWYGEPGEPDPGVERLSVGIRDARTAPERRQRLGRLLEVMKAGPYAGQIHPTGPDLGSSILILSDDLPRRTGNVSGSRACSGRRSACVQRLPMAPDPYRRGMPPLHRERFACWDGDRRAWVEGDGQVLSGQDFGKRKDAEAWWRASAATGAAGGLPGRPPMASTVRRIPLPTRWRDIGGGRLSFRPSWGKFVLEHWTHGGPVMWMATADILEPPYPPGGSVVQVEANDGNTAMLLLLERLGPAFRIDPSYDPHPPTVTPELLQQFGLPPNLGMKRPPALRLIPGGRKAAAHGQVIRGPDELAVAVHPQGAEALAIFGRLDGSEFVVHPGHPSRTYKSPAGLQRAIARYFAQVSQGRRSSGSGYYTASPSFYGLTPKQFVLQFKDAEGVVHFPRGFGPLHGLDLEALDDGRTVAVQINGRSGEFITRGYRLRGERMEALGRWQRASPPWPASWADARLRRHLAHAGGMA